MEGKSYSEKHLISAEQNVKEKEFWLNHLAGELEKCCFPYDGNKTGSVGVNEGIFEEVNFRPDRQLLAKLNKISNNSNVRMHIILTAALVILLNRYTGSNDIIVGVPIYKQDIDADFINTVLPLRNRIEKDMTFKNLLQQVSQTIFAAAQNQNYPIEILVHNLNLFVTEEDFPLFDVSVLLENIHDKKYLRHINHNLRFSFFSTSASLEGTVEYNWNLYEKTKIERIVEQLICLLQAAVASPDMPVIDIDILPEKEKRQLLEDFNDNQVDFPAKKTIYQLIEDHAEKTPGRAASLFKSTEVTYGQLNHKANRLARYLHEKGVRKNQIVGILLDRSPFMVQSILAIWKVGAAYLPLDTHNPVKRIMGILEDSKTNVLLTQSGSANIWQEHLDKRNIIILDKHWEKWENFAPGNLNLKTDMDGLAYVIYTSGSTGKPRGVIIEHLGMMNHIYAKINDLQITVKSVVAQNASHTFDISVWQFFAALVQGARIQIYPNEVILDPEQFITELIEGRVTILEVVPSYLSVMLDYLDTEPANFRSLDYLLITGETARPGLIRRWFEKYPDIKLVNAYGPTEAADDITHNIMERAPDVEQIRIPIGKPLQNLNIYIVNENMKLCPTGVKGEICVSGVGVGRGYLNRPELTAEKFLPAFNRSQKAYISKKLFKTGDWGCWLPDGNIDFLGRKDYQVKVRGFRIEPGEIEDHILKHESIKEVVVIAKNSEQGVIRLYAYVVPTNEKVEIPGIKTLLSKSLPDYMIPDFFIEMKHIPLTPNGKIDRKALPEPELLQNNTLPYITQEMLKSLEENAEYTHTGITPAEVNQVDDEIHEKRRISQEEKKKILTEFNNTQSEYPKEKLLHQLFEQQVEKHPGNTAVVYKDNKLTAGHLNKKANRLAWLLRSKGVVPNSVVAVMTGPSLELIIGLLGVLKAGGGYMPIEPAYPAERLRFMLTDSNTKLFLTQQHLEDRVTFRGDILILENPLLYHMQPNNLNHVNIPDDLLHMLYTSGTTGKPKGIVISHKNLVNYITWFSAFIRITHEDKTLLNSSFAYDLCYSSLYSSILSGGELHILPVEVYQDPEQMVNYIQKNEVTFIKLTPSHYSIIINSPYFTKKAFRKIRLVCTCGEEINVKDIEKTHEICQHIEIMNHYGPSECTTGSVAQFIDFNRFEDYKEHPTIGYPIFNTQAYIVDKGLNLLPVNVVGELCISGDGMSRGYPNHPDLTEEKFLHNPFAPGERMYRTGDMARWRPDGAIEYHGRMDHQVKIKGYRIELSEIENQLLKLKEIKKAVIVVNQFAAGDKYLCAFVVSEKPLMKLEVIEYLKQELPAYMVPAYIIQLEKMPLNPNGKIHRKALPDPIKVLNIGKTSATPTDETEKKIVSIWSEVLGIESHQIALEDNFFELGGNSINCLKVINSISRVFDLKISMADIFVNPTIKMLASTIKQETLLNQSECVVKLNRGNPNKILFIVHSGEGVVYIYKKLAKLLEDEFSVYGIQAKGLFQKSKLPKNSKELIGYYLEEIKMVQKNGPYIIAGYCGVGTICAYELTRMLEDQGECVKHLIIVDEPPFITGFYIKFLHTKERIVKLLKNIPIFSNSKRNSPPPTGLEKAEKIAEDMLEQRKKNVLNNLRKVLKKVKPARIINTSILVIKARDTRSLRLNKNHWSQMTKGKIRLVEARGNHESIFHVPYVNKIVKTIKKLD